MSLGPYRRIVRKLKADGFESAYLDRLHQRLGAEEEEMRLEVEVRAEIAAALGRSGLKADAAFLEMEVAKQAVERAAPGERAEAVRAFNEARARAEEARLHLRIHREAVGFRQHEEISRLYPLPPRLRA